MDMVRQVFGTKSERDVKTILPLVDQVNALAPAMEKLSPEDFPRKTQEFRDRLLSGAKLEDILPEAFALGREASKRAIGLRPFDVQLIGGIVLHQGKIAEMRTGEGKTLVAVLPAYLNALTGKGVHIITVNDYLAKRDRFWMGPVYEYLGLRVGCIQHDIKNIERREAYAADVTYVTNNEIGFDYLRDNMVIRGEDRSLRGFNFAVIDEVDSILVDEARTPLIISGPAEESTEKYYLANRIVPHLKIRMVTEAEEIKAKYEGVSLEEGYDAVVDEKNHSASLTEEGVRRCEKLLGVANIYDDVRAEWPHHITQALRAHYLYKSDVQYVVKDGDVVIVDEFTGRLMPGRRWSDGLHQAVEAKENLRIKEENQTLATITFQNFFKLYQKRSGMTGTAMTEARELWEIYKLDVVEIPTHRTMIRMDESDQVFRTEREKFQVIITEVERSWKKGQPVLVGTRSIEKSEKLSSMLRLKGVPHQVLNAKYHEMEAQIIAQAGKKAGVTIATNMAGRGTDIILGGNPPDLDEQKLVIEAGGLRIIGSERHESRRIDNQLRGRSGRQGDPGSSIFYVALDDELMRLFGSERISMLLEKLGMEEGEVIEHPWVTKAIANAQRKVELYHFDVRKQLLEYDNVMNKQREAVYRLRNTLLDGADVSPRINDMIEEALDEKEQTWCPPKEHPEKWDVGQMKTWLKAGFNVDVDLEARLQEGGSTLSEILRSLVHGAYKKRHEDFEKEGFSFKELERAIFLQVIDMAWKDHLYQLDHLKQGIGLRAYAQRDPLIEYQKESYQLFEGMMGRIQEETLGFLFRIPVPSRQIQAKPPVGAAPSGNGSDRQKHPSAPNAAAGKNLQQSKTIGRNDDCPCGSGKKYKRCHGAGL
ncbi:MAG: preprotein translocase subunit SecA [Elusimicrobia bacterium]|nr:preprotein translocase subunit SecA [Elusimicrobiota bacterium]